MHSKVSIAPFTDFSRSSTLRTSIFLAALLPHVAALFASKSWSSLWLIFACALGSALSEADGIMDKKTRNFSLAHSLFAGTLTGFFLPQGYPPASALLTTFVFMFASRKAFGPAGLSWINPVALAVTAAWFMGREAFGTFSVIGPELSAKNPSMSLIDGAMLLNGADERITSFLNDSVFRAFGVSIPNGYVSLFWDNHASIPAFRFTLLTLLSSLFIFALDIKKPAIPLFSLFVYLDLVKFASPLVTGAEPMGGDVLLALLSSGLLFAFVFVLQWPGTLPSSAGGRIAYALLCGIVAFVFCGTGTSPAGAAASILFSNLFSPAIQVLESRGVKKRLSALLAERLGENAK